MIELTRLIERYGATTVVDDATPTCRRGTATGGGAVAPSIVVMVPWMVHPLAVGSVCRLHLVVS